MSHEVARYYDLSQKWYNLFWTDRESLAMHQGFYDESTRSRKEALINQYREIERALQIERDHEVLDAGCGVGGACIWLARSTGARITGVTISGVQLEQARRNARRFGVADRALFEKRDFFDTGFADDTFDRIFSIESFSYAYPRPARHLRELYRILKPGGRLCISEGFLARDPATPTERSRLDGLCRGWILDGGCTLDDIRQTMRDVGFDRIRHVDKTAAIMKTVNHLWWLGILLWPAFKLTRAMRIISEPEYGNIHAALNHKPLVKAGVMGHVVFHAEKNGAAGGHS